MAGAALLEAHDVVDAEAGEHRQLLSAEAGCAARVTGGQADVDRREAVAPGSEELAELSGGGGAGIHSASLAPAHAARVVLAFLPSTGTWPDPAGARRLGA
ncbi:hypothetical protein GCM10017602_24860 [Herbiconiux flava]|nr:hypothetical protein GCM10017602_24860 [Herbiconiux flava]